MMKKISRPYPVNIASLLLATATLSPLAYGQTAAAADEEDPFGFLLDDSNTVMSSGQPDAKTPAAEPSQQQQHQPTAVDAAIKALVEAAQDDDSDPFAFLLDERNTVLSSRQQTAELIATDRGEADLELLYVAADNFTLGRYSGLQEKGWQARLSADYRNWLPSDNSEQPHFWRARLRDVGSDVQEASFSFGQRDSYRLTAAIDQQLQANNDSGRTPFSGKQRLVLPSNWLASNTTAGMSGSNREFKQQLERDKYSLNHLQKLNNQWTLIAKVSSEEKQGQQTLGAAFYIDASNPHSAILPQPVDQTTNEFDLAFRYSSSKLQFNGSYLFSQYDNHATYLQWQNPYDGAYGADTDYPNGTGQTSMAPDSDLHQLRAQANYRFSPTLRAFADMTYSLTSQDDDYLPYTSNSSLTVSEALPRGSLDGEIETTVINSGLLLQPMHKLSVDLRYHYSDRSNDSPRDGYLYPRGDSADQPASRLTIYNRPVDVEKNRFEASARYRLPKRIRLSLKYKFENIARYNTASKETDEDSLEAALRFAPSGNTQARASIRYSDRAASRYRWDQSYYALLDAELINLTSSSQRYNNHPAMSQFYLANREMWAAKLNINYLAGQQWNHSFDLKLQDKDYDRSELGLTEEQQLNLTLSSNYQPNERLTLSGYYSFDSLEAEQSGRAFRGGTEKNAFVTTAPYPQASDPEQDWTAKPEQQSHALGINVDWDLKPGVMDMTLDYSFVDTTVEQPYSTGTNLSNSALPDDGSRLHHLQWHGNYYYSANLSLKLNYQYYRFNEDNWATDGINSNTLDKVLGTGERSPNDSLHMLGLSVTYRLR